MDHALTCPSLLERIEKRFFDCAAIQVQEGVEGRDLHAIIFSIEEIDQRRDGGYVTSEAQECRATTCVYFEVAGQVRYALP